MMNKEHEAFHLLLKKLQNKTAAKEDLQRLLELLAQTDPDTLFPAEEWLQEDGTPLRRRLQRRIMHAARGNQPVSLRPVRRWLPYAAAVLLLIAAAVFLRYNLHRAKRPAYITAAAGFGEIRRIVLPDSTTAVLNACSSIRYPADFTASREIFLDGEAFFDVHPEPARSFTVHSHSLQTRVLGTSFSMRDYRGEKPLVAVLTGKVKVDAAKGRSVVLNPGNSALYDSAAAAFTTQAQHIEEMDSWRKGVIDMNNRSLREVAAVLERWYGVRVRLLTPGIDALVASGTQTNTSLQSVLESICFVFNLQYRQEGRDISIWKK